MSTETEIEQQQNDDAFNAGFNSVRPSDDYTPPEEKEESQQEEESAAVAGDADATQDANTEEQTVFAGLTETQLKAILERATRVDAIEDQLRKAHGKIGELHGSLKELQQARQQTTQQAPAGDLDNEQLSEFESTFPEFAPAVEARARRIAQEVLQQAQQTGQQIDPEQVSKTANLAVMDSMHRGWRETVNSDDFKLWMATQPEPVQQTYQTTWNAAELGLIVSEFEQRQQVATQQRSSKSKQRLEAALAPDARASKVQHGISDEDAFTAGFESVRNPRYY